MTAILRALRMGLGVGLCMFVISCGGGGGSSAGTPPPTPIPPPAQPPPPAPTSNVASVIVDAGPLPMTSPSVNTLFTSVTLCVPGTTTCQTIDHIEVDTGSFGLRILSGALTLTLQDETLVGGNTLVECTQFADGFSWGPVALTDMTIAGETAHSLPVQIIGDPRFTNIPAACSSTGQAENTVSAFGANGILGIGPFELDCGDCDTSTAAGFYYACAAAATPCTATVVPDAMQVPNPIPHFAVDNNGSIVNLPAVAATGAVTLSGSLIFGIDTQSNNQSGTQTVLTVNGHAELLMTFNGTSLPNSFIDSGSNGIFFADSNIPACTVMGFTDFYCPMNTEPLTVSIQGTNGVMANNLPFSVANAVTLFTTVPTDTFNVQPQLAGTLPAAFATSFDYGLAFFYGKRVAVAINGATTTVGTGPYIAF
jgi:hypothetical protein